jgi:hypothetical protein
MSRYAAAAEDSRTFTIKTSFEHDGPDTLNVVTMAAMHPLRPLTFSIRVGARHRCARLSRRCCLIGYWPKPATRGFKSGRSSQE